MPRVNILAHHSSKLFAFALATPGCEAINRLPGEIGLIRTLTDLERPADLTVVSAHGTAERRGKPWIGTSNRGGAWVEFAPESLGAPILVLAMCCSGRDPFVDRVRSIRPGVTLIGTTANVRMSNLALFTQDLVTRFLSGEDIREAFDATQAAGHKEAEEWKLSDTLRG